MTADREVQAFQILFSHLRAPLLQNLLLDLALLRFPNPMFPADHVIERFRLHQLPSYSQYGCESPNRNGHAYLLFHNVRSIF